MHTHLPSTYAAVPPVIYYGQIYRVLRNSDYLKISYLGLFISAALPIKFGLFQSLVNLYLT